MKGGSYVERSNHILAVPSDPTDHGKENTEDMAKLMAEGYELLDPGRYVLEVLEAEAVNEYGPQLKLKLRVTEGEHEGFEFTDYPNRGAENGVKIGTKAWDVFAACLDTQLTEDEPLDTDDLLGKKFEAMVSVKKTGKGNRTEHGTLGPHRPKRMRTMEEPDTEQPEDGGDDFSNIPF